jgi:DNA-directed RNA polymerase subunit L
LYSPHITIAQYAQEDPNSSNSQLIVQCQSTNAVPAEQSLVESLHMMKEMCLAVQETLDSAVQEFEKK